MLNIIMSIKFFFFFKESLYKEKIYTKGKSLSSTLFFLILIQY